MTRKQDDAKKTNWKELMSEQEDFLRPADSGGPPGSAGGGDGRNGGRREGRTHAEPRQDLAAWLKKWSGRYPKLCDWVETNIEETLTFYRLPRQHHKNLKSTNLLERLNEEIKRRTLVVRIFPNNPLLTESCC